MATLLIIPCKSAMTRVPKQVGTTGTSTLHAVGAVGEQNDDDETDVNIDINMHPMDLMGAMNSAADASVIADTSAHSVHSFGGASTAPSTSTGSGMLLRDFGYTNKRGCRRAARRAVARSRGHKARHGQHGQHGQCRLQARRRQRGDMHKASAAGARERAR